MQISPNLLMRLSAYEPSPMAERLWLVQACQPQGYCEAVVSFRDALGPVYSVNDQGALVVELLGGRIVDIHRGEIRWRQGSRPIIVQRVQGRSAEDLRRFRARMGLPPGNSLRDLCDRAMTPRPSFAAP